MVMFNALPGLSPGESSATRAAVMGDRQAGPKMVLLTSKKWWFNADRWWFNADLIFTHGVSASFMVSFLRFASNNNVHERGGVSPHPWRPALVILTRGFQGEVIIQWQGGKSWSTPRSSCPYYMIYMANHGINTIWQSQMWLRMGPVSESSALVNEGRQRDFQSCPLVESRSGELGHRYEVHWDH